jgi:DNA-binding GntR family transcriptional regulator
MDAAMDLIGFGDKVRALAESRQEPTRRHPEAPPSAAEHVEGAIKRLIASGEFAPGARLLEVELATRFGVSRAPVRDALRSLDKQGFVDLTPRRGAIVYQPTPADISNLYEVRAELSALGARKAAAAMDAQTRAVARAGLELMARLAADPGAEPADYLAVRTGLSDLILLSANNPRLAAAARALGAEAFTHTRVFHSAEHRRRNAEGWRRLYEAVFAHDGEGAAAEARSLTLASRDELLRQMRMSSAAAAPG